nr:uncharacterized protein LOC101033543 isoform X2 [Saimiri boliviensis boliviensis]
MGVKVEMVLYLTFPVAMFWISNQAEWFENDVIQRKVGIRGMSKGSFQRWERVQGTNLLGTHVCLPWAYLALGMGLWRLLTRVPVVTFPYRGSYGRLISHLHRIRRHLMILQGYQ